MNTLLIYFVISLSLIAISNIWNIHKIFIFIVVGIGVLSFFYAPSEDADLYRHYESIEFYGEMGLDWVLKNRCDLNPLSSLLLYVFSFFNDPRFFASFSTIITYGFTFMLLYRVSIFYSLSKNTIFILSAFLLLNWNFLLVVSNCRIFMLYAIIAYFFYMEYIEGRFHKTAFVVYILSIFFHYGILLIVVPRIFMYLYKPTSKMVYFWIFILILLFIYKGNTILQSFWVDLVLKKVEGYEQYTTFGILQYLNSLFCIITCCICIIGGEYPIYPNKKYLILFWINIFMILFQITNYQVVYRESNIIASLSVVPFSQLMYNETNKEMLKIVLIVQSIMTFVYYLCFVYQTIEFNF